MNSKEDVINNGGVESSAIETVACKMSSSKVDTTHVEVASTNGDVRKKKYCIAENRIACLLTCTNILFFTNNTRLKFQGDENGVESIINKILAGDKVRVIVCAYVNLLKFVCGCDALIIFL